MLIDIKSENLNFKDELTQITGCQSLVPSAFEIFDKIAVVNLKESQLKFKE